MFDPSRNSSMGWEGATGDGTVAGPRPAVRASSRALRVKIASAAFYAPPRVETAAELAPRIGVTEDWIVSRTAVRERRISDEPVEIMGSRAARAALGSGGAPDLIVNASVSARQLIPDTALHIQGELGLEGIPAFSIHASCLSFLVALHKAATLVVAGGFRRVLVVSAERGSQGRNMSEPESAALLGDGAGAVVLEGRASSASPGGSSVPGRRVCSSRCGR